MIDIDNAYDIVVNKLSLWIREFVRLLPNMALASLILVIGFLVAKWSRSLSRRILGRLIHNETLDKLLATLIYIFFLGLFFFMALSVMQLDKAVTSILAGAGILGLALAFAFQDIAANFMSGIFLFVRRPLHPGDTVKIKDYMGTIATINLRDTVLQTFQGQMVIIPNKEVLQNPIENYSLLGKRRMDLNVGVSYGDDLEKVKRVTLEAVSGIENLTDDEITFFYDSFNDSSINFNIRLWVTTPAQINYLQVRSDAIMAIKKAYDKNGITIPFPIRTLDFGKSEAKKVQGV